MAGQRPNLQEIKGPEDFELFARTCIEKCWNGKPQERPRFVGKIFAYAFATDDVHFIHAVPI